jgi:hypothetical protein
MKIMKPFLTFIACLLSLAMFAQTASPKAGTNKCYQEWYSLFKERGANPVPDGMQDVIISIRGDEYGECFMGRVDVAGEKMIGKLQVQKMDGSYEEFDKKVSATYQNDQGTLKEELRAINNGMSSFVRLADGEIIGLFFYKSLADKPKSNKKAPSPAVLVKN